MTLVMRPGEQRVLLLAILLLAFALRVGGLGTQELRGDEAFGYFFQQRTYAGIIADTIALDEPHPVASYFVLKPWLQVAGASEFALRFVSMWFSVVAVALLVKLARRLQVGRFTQTLAALLLALSPYAVWHAQDARMYGMSLALNVATVWLALEALARRRLPWVAAYIVAAWLALQTHYFSAFILVGLSLFVVGRALVHPPARRAVFDWFVWNVFLVALMAPWLSMAGETIGGYVGNGDSPGLGPMLQRALAVMGVGESVPAGQRLPWALLLAALLALGGVKLWNAGSSGRRTLWLLVCVGIVPVLLTWVGAWNRPIFNERYLIAALPGLLLLAASVAEPAPARWPAMRRRAAAWAGALLVLLLLAGMGSSLVRARTDPAFSKSRGWRELASTLVALGANLPPESVRYAQNYPDPTLWYYTGDVPHLVLPPAALDANAAEREVSALAAAGVLRVVLAQQPNPAWDPGALATTALGNAGYTQIAALPVANWTVQVWDGPLPALTPRDDAFARGLTLRGVTVLPELPAPGALLTVLLAWSAAPGKEPLAGSEAVSVQLLSDAGAVLAQHDAPLPATLAAGAAAGGETSATSLHGILLPQVLPPGDLRLIVAVYDPAAAGAPRVPTAAGADHVELARWR